VLEPVAHEELHTDIGAYDESIAEVASTDSFPGWGGGAMTREEFAALRVGDRFLNTDDKHVYTVTQINCNGIGVGIIAVRDDKQGPGKEHGCYFWRTSIDAMSPLPPVEHEELHTDVDAYDESLWQDEKIISSLKEKPLTSKMEENIVNSESSEEKIPYWKTIDPEHPKNETERRAFAIVEETSRDPEYAKVSKR
jgi:hypothetical protein